MSKILVSSRYFIPEKNIDVTTLKKKYAYRRFDEQTCKMCKVYRSGKRYNKEDCAPCDAYLGVVKLWRKAKLEGKSYIGLPVGNPKGLEANFGINLSKVKDHRAYVPMEAKLKFIQKLYDGSPVGKKKTADQKGLVKLAVQALKKDHAGILQSPPRSGKCVHGDTIISTNKGILPIKDLFLGKDLPEDKMVPVSGLKILTYEGYKKVSHLYTKKVKESVIINTAQGFDLQSTLHHPVLVFKPDLSHAWVKAEDIKEGDYLCLPKKNQNIIGKAINNDIAWMLGALVANGTLCGNSKRFHSNNTYVMQNFISLAYKVFGIKLTVKTEKDKADYVNCNNLINKLKPYDLVCKRAAFKTIPSYVLRADEVGVRAFLSGYLSCDSYMQGKGEIELCTASPRMARELHVVLSRFGIYGRLSSYMAKANNSKKPKLRRYFSLHYSGEAKQKLLEFNIYKDTVDYTYKNDHKYLLHGVPYIRDAMIGFIRKNSKPGGIYTVKGNKVRRKIPFGGSKGKNLVARSSLLQADWESALPLVKFFDPILANNIVSLLQDNFIYTKVTKKRISKKPITVYDVSVPSNNSFVGNGIVNHNTAMAAAITVELGQRTLILANKEDLLLQFKATFEGSDKYPAFTNAKEEEFRLDRPIVKIVKTLADFKRAETADIVLVLYQKFVRDGSIDRIYDFLIDKFGLVIVDEVHRGSADGFAKILLRINPAYRLGLSATPNNKNKNRRKLLKESMGKVVARSTSVSLPTRVEVFETGVTIPKPHRLWVYAIKYLSSKFERNKMIVQEVFKDLRAGRKGILIPVQFKDHIQELTDLINNQADYNNRNKDEDWPMPLCVPYTGALTPNKKEQYKNAIDTGEAKVMVSINSMITEGIDLSNPDTLYQVIPMSGDKEVGAPIFQQLSFRVATFTPTKVDPVIKVFVDALPQSFYCFRSLMTTEVFPRLGNEYLMSKYDVARAKEIIDEVNQTRAYIPPNPAGKRIFSREVVEGVDEFGGNKVKATHKKKKKTIAKDGLRKSW